MAKLVSSGESVREIFSSMSYGPAPESDDIVQNWLNEHDRSFGHFIDGKMTFSQDICSKSVNVWNDCKVPGASSEDKNLGQILEGNSNDVKAGIESGKRAYGSWSKLSGQERSTHLYNFARSVQKHSRLLAVLEALENGKSIRETRDIDIPLVVRHLYYYAGWAKLTETELKNWKSMGVVGAIVPWNFPLMLLTWKLAPALAMGNTIVLKPAPWTSLTSLLLAEIASEAGLPSGVFNVVTGSGSVGQMIAEDPLIAKVAFTGSTKIGKLLRRVTSGSGKKLSLELGGKNPMIVYDSADLDSTVESIVDAIWFNQGQVCSAGSKLLIQESIFEKLVQKMKKRLCSFRIGNSLDKAIDMGPIINETQKNMIDEYVQGAKNEGADVFQIDVPDKGNFYPPTIITNVNTASKVVQEEIFGPVVCALPFRTAKEAITIANNTIYGLGASVHTEQLQLALETAKLLKAGSIWINAHNLFDAAAGFGGYKQSGFGRDGGREGLMEYVIPTWEPTLNEYNGVNINIDSFGSKYEADGPHIKEDDKNIKIDHTYKLYYGGSQKRPDGAYSCIIKSKDGSSSVAVGMSNRKDVRNAVEAANKAQPSWSKKSGFNRSQILYYIAENMELRKNEFADKLKKFTDQDLKSALKEVTSSIERLFYWAAYADKYGGEVQETQLYGTVIKIHEPIGVIGIACPESNPLLGFVSLMAPAISRGNSVIMIPNEKYPLAALDMYQIFDTSDLPGGVVNILTGNRDHITMTLVKHHDIDSFWYFGSREGSKFVEYNSSVNVKRTWVNYGQNNRNWFDPQQGQGEEFLYQTTQAKNIWLAMENIFAN